MIRESHGRDETHTHSSELLGAHQPRRPTDRILWGVISERLSEQRGLDLSDVDLVVENGEVILSGTVRRKADILRMEDLANIDGVRHLQNNLRLRERSHWTFL